MSNANTASAGLPKQEDLRVPPIDPLELQKMKEQRLAELDKCSSEELTQV